MAAALNPPAPVVARRVARPWLGPLLLVLAFVALVVVISPLHETPVQDDWDYARTVRLFLERGVFERSEIAQAAEVFTTLWGALFASVAGFSFVTLRFSTLTLSLGSVLLMYALLGELGFDPPRRLLGAATLLVCPLFLFLSHSFMTDVPTLFWELAALTLYCRAWRTANVWLAIWAGVCVALATLTRQIGLVVGLATAGYALLWPPTPGRLRWAAACALLPILATGLYLVWLQVSGGVTWANRQVTVVATLDLIRQGGFIGVVVRRAVMDLLTLSLYALPVWLAALAALSSGWRALRASWLKVLLWAGLPALVIGGVVARLAQEGKWMPYLTDALTAQGLRPYLGYYAYEAGSFRPDLLPLPAWVALTLVAALLGWLFAALSLRAAARLWPMRRAAASVPVVAAPARAGLHLVYLSGLALAIVTLLFGEFYERFLLLLLPIVLIVILDRTRTVRLTWAPAALALAFVALSSVLLLQDFWGWMDVRLQAAQALEARGIPDDLIDAGYEWNATHLYEPAMAQIQLTGVPMTIIPWLVVLDPQYMLSFAPVPGYHIEQDLPFATPFGAAHGHLFVLRRDDGTGGRQHAPGPQTHRGQHHTRSRGRVPASAVPDSQAAVALNVAQTATFRSSQPHLTLRALLE